MVAGCRRRDRSTEEGGMIADEEMQMRARSCEGGERERDPSECQSGSGRVAETDGVTREMRGEG